MKRAVILQTLLLLLFAFSARGEDWVDGKKFDEFEIAQWDAISAPSVAPTNAGRIYYNGTSDTLRLSLNGAAYSDIITTLSNLWTRAGTTLSPTTAGDSILITGTLGAGETTLTGNLILKQNVQSGIIAVNAAASAYTKLYFTADNFLFNEGAFARFAIINGGNVGIGIAIPTSALHVYKANAGNGNTVVANIYRNTGSYGGSTILQVGDGNGTIDMELNSGYSGTGWRYGTYADSNIVNNYTGTGGFNSINLVTGGIVRLRVMGGTGATGGNIGIRPTGTGTDILSPTAYLHIGAGTASASTAPLKFTSGTLNTTAEAGAVEFLTDDFFATITTSASRKAFILDDGARLTSTKVPVASTNGRLIDSPLIYGSSKFQTTDNSFETVTSSIVAGYRAVWGATYMGRLSGQSNGLCLDSDVTNGKILAIQSETFGGTTTFGKSYRLSIKADYNGLGLLPAGVFFSGNNLASGQGMSFIPDDAGTAGVKLVFAYTNQTAWQNAIEFANVASGAGTLILAGGNTDIQIGTGVAGKDYKLTFDGETNDGVLTWMEDENWFKFDDNIHFEGTAVHDLTLDRHPTTNTAGNSLTIQGGGATSGATDKDGGMVIIQPGLSTGTGKGSLRFKRLGRASATGTADNALYDAHVIGAEKVITSESSVNLFEIALPAGGMTGGTLTFQIMATDGTDFSVHTGKANFASVNKGGVYTSMFTDEPVLSDADAFSTAGHTITDTWAITAGVNKITVSVTVAVGIMTANDIRIYWTLNNGGRNAVTQL